MGDLDRFDGYFVSVSLEIGAGYLAWPGISQRPDHRRCTGFVKQADRHRHALDGVQLDLIEPVPEFVIRLVDAFLHRHVTGLFHPGHRDLRKLGAVPVTVLVAVSRPAEFIEITFQQQMQKS